MKILIKLLLVISLISCSSTKESVQREEPFDEIEEIISSGGTTKVRYFSLFDSTPRSEKRSKKRNFKRYEKLTFKNNVMNNSTVQWWINYYITKDRERFQRMLNRGERYKEVIETILSENGLPEDLYYLAFVESGFVLNAKSRASAQGVWQFMKGTAKQYGLVVDSYMDERNDPIRATEAASKYLRKLYSAYNSWELAFAAYNAGEYRVLSSIMKVESRDFWKLSEKKILPKETRNYVPKILAARHVAKNWSRYGFSRPTSEGNSYPDLESLEVPSPIKLSTISQKLKIPLDDLKKYNPHLHRGVVSPRVSRYELWVPVNYYSTAKDRKYLLRSEKVHLRGIASVKSNKKNYYRVKSGDTLSVIAENYGTSMNHLKAINNLNGSKILVGQKLRVTQKSYYSSKSKDVYRVRTGDTLSNVSERFNIRISTLRKFNDLNGNKIFVGQYLNLRKKRFHEVKSGESLGTISRRYGTSIRELLKKNKLRTSTIYPGQMLRI
jgi:membrane-bound lytic murein transglycosylase D